MSPPRRPEVSHASTQSPASVAEAGGSWFATVSQYLGLYTIYVFVSGWAFGDFYLRQMGLSPRWIDLSVTEVLVTGFLILFTGGKWLGPFYVLIFLLPLVVEVSPWARRGSVRVVSATVLVALLFPVYLVSRAAGAQQAQIDKNATSSRLPVITFSDDAEHKYVGRLLYLRSGTYFIRDVKLIDSDDADDASSGLVLSIYRAEDIKDIRVVGYP